jgi:hypothetical protein
METKKNLTILLDQIKFKNNNKESVKELCLEYIKQNNINNLEQQMREIQTDRNIDYIMTNIEKKYIEENDTIVPKQTSDLKDNILDIEELNIEETDLDKLETFDDPEEINYYANKPELNEFDSKIPIVFEDNSIKKQLKKELLKPIKKKSKKKKLVISRGKNKIDKDTSVKESNIKASQVSDDGKKRRKLHGIKIREGNCVFPYKKDDKYITEDDGCIEEKLGKMCATSVNKDDDYKPESLGFCE